MWAWYLFAGTCFLTLCRKIASTSSSSEISEMWKRAGITIRDKDSTSTKTNDSSILVRNDSFFKRLICDGPLGFAEAYMHNDFETNDLKKLILKLKKNREVLNDYLKRNKLNLLIAQIKSKIAELLPNNTYETVKKNVSHHYDIGNDLYEEMLGKSMVYTCGYFNKDNMTLEDAQTAKLNLVAHKLNLKEGMTILDIGCGFGAAAHFMASRFNVKVIGVTLSKEQLKYANEHFSHPNVEIKYCDYRELSDKDYQFDRIYSIGMFEQVGRKNYHEYYNKCYELLKDDGIMVIHTIGTNNRRVDYNSFIMKYIFPESELPHLSSLTGKFADKWNLEDMQDFGLSYAKTLTCWYNNLNEWKNLPKYKKDSFFVRMWEYYLIACICEFEVKNCTLWHFVYTKRKMGKLLPNCHYIYE